MFFNLALASTVDVIFRGAVPFQQGPVLALTGCTVGVVFRGAVPAPQGPVLALTSCISGDEQEWNQFVTEC